MSTAPTVPQDAGPILFLNPAVLLDCIGSVLNGGQMIHGIRNAPPQTNGTAERLNSLVRETGACVVLTDLRQIGDVRPRLHRHGLRATFHPSFGTDVALAGGSGGTDAWLAAHGAPPHVIIDRAPAEPVAGWIEVGIGAELPAATVDAAILALLGD